MGRHCFRCAQLPVRILRSPVFVSTLAELRTSSRLQHDTSLTVFIDSGICTGRARVFITVAITAYSRPCHTAER